MFESGTSPNHPSVLEQLESILQQTEAPKPARFITETGMSIEIPDPDFIEAKFIVQQLAAVLSPASFIHCKTEKSVPLSKKRSERTEADTLDWYREIAWQLYPDRNMLVRGLPKKIQQQREQKVTEALQKNQPLDIDLGILWVGDIDPQKQTMTELAVANGVVGLLSIIDYYHQLDPTIKANFKLRIAPQPNLASPPNAETLDAYAQQLLSLVKTLAQARNIDLEELGLDIQPLDLETSSSPELNLELLITQITDYWRESEAVFEKELTQIQNDTGLTNLTWTQLAKHQTWTDLPQFQHRNTNFYGTEFLQTIGDKILSQLDSFKTLPASVAEHLGWLSPNFKESLLRQTATFSGLADPNQSYEVLMANETLVSLVIESLVKKILAQLQLETTFTDHTLNYEFAAKIPDAPRIPTHPLQLKIWGNLTHHADDPWEKPRVISRAHPTATSSPPQPNPNRSTPENHGLQFQSPVENEVAINSVAIVSIGEHQIEVSIRSLPQQWLLATLKIVFIGVKP